MISRKFSKLSNKEIAEFLNESGEKENMNINVTRAVESTTDLWTLANMKSLICTNN